jgi:hypothetical protein
MTWHDMAYYDVTYDTMKCIAVYDQSNTPTEESVMDNDGHCVVRCLGSSKNNTVQCDVT